MHDVDARHAVEDLAGEMVRAADPGGGKEQLAGLASRQRNVVVERVCRHGGVNDKDHGIARQQRDRCKVLERFIIQRHADMGCDDERGFGGHQQDVTVGVGFCHHRGPDSSRSAGAVLDHEGLAEGLLEVR